MAATSRQAEHQARLRQAGWTSPRLWLSPEDSARFKLAAQRYGSASEWVRVMLAMEGER